MDVFQDKRHLSEKRCLFKWRPFSQKMSFLAPNSAERHLSNNSVEIILIPTWKWRLSHERTSFEKRFIHTKVLLNGLRTHDTTTFKKRTTLKKSSVPLFLKVGVFSKVIRSDNFWEKDYFQIAHKFHCFEFLLSSRFFLFHACSLVLGIKIFPISLNFIEQ